MANTTFFFVLLWSGDIMQKGGCFKDFHIGFFDFADVQAKSVHPHGVVEVMAAAGVFK